MRVYFIVLSLVNEDFESFFISKTRELSGTVNNPGIFSFNIFNLSLSVRFCVYSFIILFRSSKSITNFLNKDRSHRPFFFVRKAVSLSLLSSPSSKEVDIDPVHPDTKEVLFGAN